jgi:ubiquitin C-terminal hydrolase
MKPIPDSKIVEEWQDLQQVIWSNNGVVSPNRFVYNVQQLAKAKNRELFTGWAQNDMSEFLLFMVECIHNSISRGIKLHILGNIENDTDKMATACYGMLRDTYSKEYSEIMDMFYGIYVSEILSTDGSIRHAIKPESYFILDLPIIDDNQHIVSDLYESLDLFTRAEFLEGDNAWLNEKTGKKENIRKQISFWNFPKIIVITLKRFTPDGQYKINNQINFPIEDFNISKYVRGYNANSHVYDLYGVCNHSGGTLGGHYTAFVKNSQNNWIHYNDNSIQIVSNPQEVITPLAYCLFYRKKNNFI